VILIEVNGQQLEVNEGAVLNDALELSKAFYLPGATTGILKGRYEKGRSDPGIQDTYYKR